MSEAQTDKDNLQLLLAETRPLRELGRAYENVRARIVDLLLLPGDVTTTPVPACPEWTIRGVLSHLVGVCADVLGGNIDGAGTDEWTAAQVESRRGRSLGELFAEWDEVGPKFATLLDDFPGRIRMQPVADITVHEHDIRGALRRPGARESQGVLIGLDFLVAVFLEPGMTALDLGPLEVHAGERTFIAGTGERKDGDLEAAWQAALRSSDTAPPAMSPPIGVLTVEPFELFRALSGRRSADQIRGFDWSVDPEPYLPIFGYGPFTVREADLVE